MVVKEPNHMDHKNRIAQWAFDTSPILGRFHLWLEDVRIEWIKKPSDVDMYDSISFVDGGMERRLIMTAAVTALGTQLFGRYGEGRGLDKRGINQVKKDADAVSAYAMSESLWYLSRSLPENHAIMVCLGEGLMPKGGETPDMGSNPMLGFGRIYARPQVANFLDELVQRMINVRGYSWKKFYKDVSDAGITIWGTAIDTLENTSRFAKGESTGPLTVLHMFDQPLCLTRPYEGYVGNLLLPGAVVRRASELSVLINFFTPRAKILEAIQNTYPDIKPGNVHVWTLRGPTREPRIGTLWAEWDALGVHRVEDGWKLNTGQAVFTDSGTYAPTFQVGTWEDDQGETHLFLVDGYAASAEAMQAASLCPVLDIDVSLSIFSSRFKMSYEREAQFMHLNPKSPDFGSRLSKILGEEADEATISRYQALIHEASDAGLPIHKWVINADDFFPEKEWRLMAFSGYMLPDPYTGAPGVETLSDDTYQVTVRFTSDEGDKRAVLALRLMETMDQSWLVFNPLLNRFLQGEDYLTRPVKISDSGRIRNELQTLCSEALEHGADGAIRVAFDKIPEDVISLEKRQELKEILQWYKASHPIWFGWLDLG